VESPYESIHWNAATFTSTGTAVRVGQNGRIAWSTDQGHSWTDATTDANTNALAAVAFGASGIGIAVGDAGSIRRSGDGGLTWTTVHLGGVAMNSVTIGATGTVVAADQSGVFWRSADGGLTWTSITSGIGSTITRVAAMASGTLLASSGNGWMLRSTDDGMHWSATYSGNYVSDLVSLDSGVALAIGSGALIQRSTDDGLTWTSVVTGDRQSLQAVADVDASTAVAVGAGGRIRRTADGGATWGIVPSPVSINLYGVAFAGGTSSPNGLAVGESGTILRTSDGGQTWSFVGSWPAMGELHGVTWTSPGVAVAAGYNGMLRSIDGGATWATVAGFAPNSFLDERGVRRRDHRPRRQHAGADLAHDRRRRHLEQRGREARDGSDRLPSPTTAIALANDGTSLRSTDAGGHLDDAGRALRGPRLLQRHHLPRRQLRHRGRPLRLPDRRRWPDLDAADGRGGRVPARRGAAGRAHGRRGWRNGPDLRVDRVLRDRAARRRSRRASRPTRVDSGVGAESQQVRRVAINLAALEPQPAVPCRSQASVWGA
jgi:photosystem II stability/assembly factor-like uncharacterized protein